MPAIAITHNLYKCNKIYLSVINIWTAIRTSELVDSTLNFSNLWVDDIG